MSKKKLPQLSQEHFDLMEHIADFQVKCLNAGNRSGREAILKSNRILASVFFDTFSQLLPEAKPILDEDGLVKSFQSPDEQLATFTKEERETLKQILADYKAGKIAIAYVKPSYK